MLPFYPKILIKKLIIK